MDFAHELSMRAKVTVVAPAPHTSVDTKGNLTVSRFAVDRLPLSLLKANDPRHWKKILKTLVAGQNAVTQIVTKDNPDYLFALWALPSGYWARVAAKRSQTNFGIWALGSDIWSLGKVPLVKSVLAKTLSSSAHRFADGVQLSNDVERISRLPCSFLPSSRAFPMNEKRVYRHSPPYRLGFLGRWHHNKGIDILLDALHLLNSADWDNIEHIQIYGGGPLEAQVTSSIQRLNEENRPVTLGGFIDKRQASELLSSVDYAIIPSRIESIPVIFSDCIKAKAGIICTPVGDLPDLLEQYTVGVCADDTSPHALASAIATALRSPPIQFSAGMEDAAEQFDISSSVEKFLLTISSEN